MNMHLHAGIKKQASLEEVIEYMLFPYVINGDKSTVFIEKTLGIFEGIHSKVLANNNRSMEMIIKTWQIKLK